ncbi:unnamed protein product, partial [Staurois parvus]
LNLFTPAESKCAASGHLGLDAERPHICVLLKKNICAESASCTLPARMSITHRKVLISSFDQDLFRSCDRRDGVT